MTAANTSGRPHPRVLTKVGPLPTRPPASLSELPTRPMPAVKHRLARQELIATAMAGAAGSALDASGVQLVCDALLDALVSHEAAEALLEVERGVSRVLQRELEAQRARNASLQRQLELKINSLPLTALNLAAGAEPDEVTP